jgi:hypothetical protein
VQIQIHKNHGPQGSDGATILKKHFTWASLKILE